MVSIRTVDCHWKRLVDWLTATMRMRGWQPVDLARESTIPLSTLSGLLNCNHSPSLETQRKLARCFGVAESVIEEMTSDESPAAPRATMIPGVMGLVMLPIVSDASAGGGFNTSGFEPMAPIPGASSNIVGFKVRGDCMAKSIENGDTVVVDLARPWRDGSIVLARVADDLLIKRAFRENGHVRLKADAPGYGDIVDQATVILGVVIRTIKDTEREGR